MLFYFLSVILLIVIATVLQQFLPILSGMYDAKILLLPLTFLCSSVTVSAVGMLFLAYICGFLWDAQHVLLEHPGTMGIYANEVGALPFGYSIILYACMGFIMQGVQPLFRQGKWQFSAFLTGIALYIYLISEYVLINFVRGGFVLNEGTMLKVVLTAFFTMLASPLIYWALYRLADAFGHTISYEGLRRVIRYKDMTPHN